MVGRRDARPDNGCGRGRAIFKYDKDPKLTWENPSHAQTEREPVVCVNGRMRAPMSRGRTARSIAGARPQQAGLITGTNHANKGGSRERRWPNLSAQGQPVLLLRLLPTREAIPRIHGRDEDKARKFLRNKLKEVHANQIGAKTSIPPHKK